MKILEIWGTRKIEAYYQRIQETPPRYDSIALLFSSSMLIGLSIIAFLIGFLLTVPLIFIELEWDVFNWETPHFDAIIFYTMALVVSIFLEFYFLFLLGFYTIAYHAYHLYHIEDKTPYIEEKAFLEMLSRTIMELPEEHIIQYNINPKEYQDRDIAVIALLYKLKVILTNMLLKFIVKKLLTRSSLRIYSAYVTAIGTGIWDAFTFYKTLNSTHKCNPT